MENLKCDVCGNAFLGHNDHPKEGILCDECKKTFTHETLGELSNGKEEDEDG
jgi:formylmethanofuran dehydrogenase subunit E